MSIQRVRASLAVALACCVLAAGCDNSPEDAPSATKDAEVPAAPKQPPKAKLADQMVAAVAQGKSATAIGVHFTLGSLPTANEDLPLEIAIVPHEKFLSLRMNLEGQEGIGIVSGEAFEATSDVEPEKTFTHQVVLRPTAEGVYTIGAIVETDGSEGVVSRAYSIPVIVAPQAASAAPATTPPAQQAPAAN